jgi:hypothetical protein
VLNFAEACIDCTRKFTYTQYMSLHGATELIKKTLIGLGIAIGSIIVLVIIFQMGVMFKNIVSPPKTAVPDQKFGVLPSILFPSGEVGKNFTYNINTVSGALPQFPDRVNVYRIVSPSPNLLNLDKAKTKAETLKFTDPQGNTLPETSLGNGKYEWDDFSEIKRKLQFDIVSFDFSLTSNYLSSLTVLGAAKLDTENNAIQTVQQLLTSIELLPNDIDLLKTQTVQKVNNYTTYPQLFTIRNGVLVQTTSLSSAKVIRVDLYQKDIEYDLDTGRKGDAKLKMKLPILYPNPPYSTMSFWVASGQNTAEVDAAKFMHRVISTDSPSTYPIKTADEAYNELKNGQAYIPNYFGLDKQILVNNIYLAYYLGDGNQEYLMPIIVFEGQDNFFAYVSAIKR